MGQCNFIAPRNWGDSHLAALDTSFEIMLSRHILRVKLMQTLFAYEHRKGANRQWALEFAIPPPELMDDTAKQRRKELSEKQKKEVRRLLALEASKEELESITDPKIRTAAKKALRFYRSHNKKDLAGLKKDITEEIQKINYWCYSIIGLILAFAKVSRAYKRTNHSPFFENTLVVALGDNPKIKRLIATNSIDWDGKKSQVLSWFRDCVNTNPLYIEYIKTSNHSIESQGRIIKHIFKKIILKGSINDYFVKRDIRWFENQYIVRNMLERAIKLFNRSRKKIQIPKLSLDWKEDRLFLKNLLEETLNIEEDKKAIIAQNTKNWEVDRLPIIDRIVLEMAVSEMIHCPSIPVKVTINEYIEIAKKYSTNKSPQFINGILDTIATKLQERGEIKKSGRGLIDNK